jgi:excisionase family DNA binding protein
MDPRDQLLSVAELADYLAVPQATLYQWRHRGEGPPGFRVGRHLRYRWSDVEDWIESRLGARPSKLMSHAGRRVAEGGG